MVLYSGLVRRKCHRRHSSMRRPINSRNYMFFSPRALYLRPTRQPANPSPVSSAPRYRPFPRSETPPGDAYACTYTITYTRLVVCTSSHSLFVRCSRVVRTLFVRVRVRCSRVVRTLFVRCSYAVRTSSHERELTRELRGAPL